MACVAEILVNLALEPLGAPLLSTSSKKPLKFFRPAL